MVQLVFETLPSNHKNARDVRDAQEAFHMAEAIGLEVNVGQFGTDAQAHGVPCGPSEGNESNPRGVCLPGSQSR